MSMLNLQALQQAADNVNAALDTAPPAHVSTNVLTSIKNQMLFICEHAAAGNNPSKQLPSGTKFTYAVLASRELTSPDDLVLQALIDRVTNILKGIHGTVD